MISLPGAGSRAASTSVSRTGVWAGSLIGGDRRRRAQLGAGEQPLAGQFALAPDVALEGVARPDLEAVAHADEDHPVGEAELVAEAFRQGDAAGGVEAELHHTAHDRGLERGAGRIAERELVDQRRVAVEQRLAASLDAIGLDRRKAEQAVERRDGGAELLRRNDAPLGVQLFLERRDEHQPRPTRPSAPTTVPTEPPLAPPIASLPPRERMTGLWRCDWVNMG